MSFQIVKSHKMLSSLIKAFDHDILEYTHLGVEVGNRNGFLSKGSGVRTISYFFELKNVE